MPFNPFSAMGAKLAMILCVALGVVLVVSTLTKNGIIRDLRTDLKTATAERDTALVSLGTCRANRVALEQSLARQNASLAELATATATQAATGLKALGEAQKGSTIIRERVVQIGTRQAGADACKSANDLITESIK